MARGDDERTMRPSQIDEIVKALRDDPLVITKWYGRDDDRDVCEPLIRALDDPTFLVREMAVRELIALNDLYASMSILGTLARGTLPARLAAVEILSEIGKGNVQVFQHLAMAMTDPEKVVRLAACRALIRLAPGLNEVAAELARF